MVSKNRFTNLNLKGKIEKDKQQISNMILLHHYQKDKQKKKDDLL